MTQIMLGLGSNIERERYLIAGLDALQGLFGELALSPVYDCPSIGYQGPAFLNMVVAADTSLDIGELARRIRHIEVEHGRPPNATRSTPRQLDIDILSYGDVVGTVGSVELPRGEILENAFVLRPLADLAPQLRHPVDGRSYRELWEAYDQASQPLVRVDFSWRGRLISRAE